MFSILPDFTPRDSHSLWSASNRNQSASGGFIDTLPPDIATAHGANQHHHARQRAGQILERTALARLAADETYMQRRRLNVQNFGSSWLKPPGVPKSLLQMREEKREQEEHQEALRREQLAQELAEAEAEANGGMGMGEDDGTMDDVQLDGAQDLDDEIPDADDEFALGEDEDDDEDEDDEDDQGDEDDEDGDDGQEGHEQARREERQNDLMAARMRMNDDAFRQALVSGDPDGDDMYGGDEELLEEDQGHMLDEEDFVEGQGGLYSEGASDLGMDADLDNDVPEAESGMYEHTDSEAEISSSEEDAEPEAGSSDDNDGHDDGADDMDIGFAPRVAPLGPPQSPTLQTRSRRETNASAPRTSMDLSAFLSQDESSFMESSPVQSRRARQG